MSELQQTIDKASGQLAHAAQAASYTVVLSTADAQTLIDAAQLCGLLRERCELLGRALNAIWAIMGEEEQQEITPLLDAFYGPGKTRPATAFLSDEKIQRNGGA